MSVSPWWKTDGVLGVPFQTKSALENEIRRVIAKYQIGDRVVGHDEKFLMCVLSHHYQWETKAGVGVARLEKRRNHTPYGSSDGIWIVRVDGSSVDISWRVPISPPTHEANVHIAARYEILEQRNAAVVGITSEYLCPVCGRAIPADERHVDHTPPLTFASLIDSFVLLHQGMSYADVHLDEKHLSELRFSDRVLAEQWQDFHRSLAKLRVIHKNENLARVK